MSDAGQDLTSRLRQLQSRFTWDLEKEDMELDDLSTQLQHDIDLELGQRGAVAHSYSSLAFVRYLQGRPEEAESLLRQSEKKTRESYGEESERRLIVTYGDLAWLKYHTGDYIQSPSYCQRVQDILVKYPVDSSTDLHPEVYGEKAWTYLKLSKSYYPRAIECFCRALKLQPDDCEWNNGYAVALYRTEKDIAETHLEQSPVTKQLRRAVEINPDDGVLLSMLALKLTTYHKYQEAEGLVERALEVGPDNTQVIRYVAKYLRKQDQVDRSIDLLQRALKKSSQSAFIHHQLALCYWRKTNDLLPRKPRPEREVQRLRHLSMQHLEEALRLKSTLNHAKAYLALAYAQEHYITRAQEMFKEVLEKAEEKEERDSIRQSVYRCYAEFCQYHTFQEDQAIEYYTKAVQISTKTSEGKQSAKKLKQIAERQLSTKEHDGRAFALLGLVAKAEGDRKTAAKFYEKALDCDENNHTYLSELCDLRMELQGADETFTVTSAEKEEETED